jgi:hypothetical protein
MNVLPSALAMSFLVAAVVTSLPAQDSVAKEALAHARTEFNFTANAAWEQTAPLFGAWAERQWAPDWNPRFVYPTPARDQPGMVFQVEHGQMTSTWVNTAFDLSMGHIQYVYVLNDAMVTVIDIHLTRENAQKTGVSVVYERTALIAEANEHVEHFAKGDRKAQGEWEEQINGYLAKIREESRGK